MSKMQASQIYDLLRPAMDQAEKNENHLCATRLALAHGLQHGSHKPAGIGIEDEWRLLDGHGDTVLLTYSMQDTTRTFEPNGPDVNRLHLSLTNAAGQVLRQHGVSYYD